MSPSERQRDLQPHTCHLAPADSFPTFNDYIRRFFDNLYRSFDQRQWWTDSASPAGISSTYDCNFGSAIGQIVNNEEKFSVEVDVSHFHPEDLKVSLRHQELIIEGHQNQRRDPHGSIERHFVRKYLLPPDVDYATLTSSLKDNGILTVSARKQNVPPTTPTRNIPIQKQRGRDRQRSPSVRLTDSRASQTGSNN
ncbi:unnamed protein product [Thelazia callipaeda]|uniref:SHSP domain-containing protein n=1 Tax=Thelazia callipaeda TaxID=103827 RepID=A0A0N5CNB8_THECL|nr:unnamed protein product [Thelazia callipaeda]